MSTASQVKRSETDPVSRQARSRIEPGLLFLACLLTALSLFITQQIDSLTVAGFPFQFVTFYEALPRSTGGNFLDRLSPNWNMDGRVGLNIVFYYLSAFVLRRVIFGQRTLRDVGPDRNPNP